MFQILTGLDNVGWSAVFCDDLLAFLLEETQPRYDLELELYFRGKALVGAATTQNGAQLPLSRGTILVLVQLEIVVRSLSTRNLHRTEFVRSLSSSIRVGLGSAETAATLPTLPEFNEWFPYLITDVRNEVAKIELAIDVLASDCRTVGRDTDSGDQRRAGRNVGTVLSQHLRQSLGAELRSPNKGFDPVAERITAPANHASMVRDSIREALLGGAVSDRP